MEQVIRNHLALLFLLLSWSVMAQKNQNVQISGSLKDGSYTVYKALKKGSKTTFTKATKPWPVQYFSNSEGIEKILIKRVGLIDEYYQVDLPKYPAYFQNNTSGICVSAIDKKLYYYTYSTKSGATIKYILTSGATVTKYEQEKNTLDTYRSRIKNLQQEARNERKEERAAEAKAIAEANSLKGKAIAAITLNLVDTPKEFGMLSVFQVGITVTLTNGNVLKTKNIGGLTPYTDFEYKTTSGSYEGGNFKIYGSSDKIKNDKLSLKVWSKFNPSITGYFEHPINYRNDLFFSFQGKWGKNGRRVVGYSDYGTNGTSGHNVNITANARQANGNDVIDIDIFDQTTGKNYRCTIHKENTLHIDVRGGKGGDGLNGDRTSTGNGANGGNGGAGGTIMLQGTAAGYLQIEANTDGGGSGKGGKAKSIAYKNGTNGSGGSNGTLIRN